MKTATLKDRKHYLISLESRLRDDAKKNAKGIGYTFSEYIARLLIADMKRKISAAESVGHIYRPKGSK